MGWKTTTTVNVAAALAALAQRVLVDLDPQGNATMGSGVDKNALEVWSYHWLMSEQGFANVVQPSPAQYDVMPSNIDLTAAEVSLLQHQQRELVMRELLAKDASEYDYVLVDCPPSLNILTVNALSLGNQRAYTNAMRVLRFGRFKRLTGYSGWDT